MAYTSILRTAFRLENGESVYGQGHWAPSFRHHNGTFYIFSNVNGHTTQRYTARDPRGPWTHKRMKRSFHDLSVLFDDDGKAYVVWGYQEIRLAELNSELTDIVPGTQRVIIPKGAGMGEGLHFYKFDGKYFITSAEWNGMKMPTARADSLAGPWEINPAISVDEDFGLVKGYSLNGTEPPFEITPPDRVAADGARCTREAWSRHPPANGGASRCTLAPGSQSPESQNPSQAFQWMETPTGEIILMSLKTHRYLRVDQGAGWLVADSPGPTPDGKDGTRFTWRLANDQETRVVP